MDNKRAGWAVAYLVSFPMLLQFHMAIRPESLAFSGMLLLLCVMKRLELRKFIVIAGLLTATLTWLMPDMVFISVALWIVTLLKKVDIKVFAARFLTFVLALLLGLGVNMLTQTPGSRGRIQKTFGQPVFREW